MELTLSTINQQLFWNNFYIQLIVLSEQGNAKTYRTQPLSSRILESRSCTRNLLRLAIE